jgi:hypothetical protein
MFAFLIQNTVIISEILRREFDFAFSTLEELEDRLKTMPALSAFLDETEYYRTAYYLSSALYACGKNQPSGQLWTFLARSGSAGEWGERARRNRSPYVEPPTETR